MIDYSIFIGKRIKALKEKRALVIQKIEIDFKIKKINEELKSLDRVLLLEADE